MFKKTLLALAVTGVAVSANAATVFTSSTLADAAALTAATTSLTVALPATPAAGDALGLDNAIGGADDNCAAIATSLGAVVDLDGNTAANANADTATALTAVDGLSKSLVTYTGAAACTVQLASTQSSTSLKDGLEYSTVTELEIKPVVVAGIGGYKDEDTITLDLAGAKIDLSATTAPTISVGADGVTGAGVTFDVLDISENQVRFTVQATDALADTVKGAAVLSIAGIFLDSSDVTSATTVTVASFATNTSGTDFDPAAAKTITTLVPQYVAEVGTLLDGSIDVGKDRQQFANGGVTTDVLVVDVENKTTGASLTAEEATYVVSGDFSWMLDDDIDADEDGKLKSSEIANAVAIVGADDTLKSFALNTDMTELTITTTMTGDVDASSTITFTVPGYDNGDLDNLMIPVQDFTVAVDVQDDDAFTTKPVNMQATPAIAAGSWTLNGSVIVVPYVPFGPNTQPILRHTNAGARTGDITVRYMVEGEHTAWQALTEAGVEDAMPGVRNMLGLVNDALKGEGYDAAADGFKVALEVVTNVPSKDVHFYGGAKVTAEGQDRIHLGTFKTNN